MLKSSKHLAVCEKSSTFALQLRNKTNKIMTQIELRFFESAVSFFSKHNNSKIDWEQRRYEIAKQMLPVCQKATPEEMAKCAVECADALINELKNKKD